ncbi:beta-lactamase family protein [Sphingomonas panacisoli]|uniref:Beta-lactamase family protein n=1 Tax=Sphingomonas panacisoli TaxID=1813879 RepID=A0A5B8LJS8_9SPHN|nr:serine hydrolase domain-containing protein [Sphingomonas panacisoli]QDZ08488.1 beta-lactamase family protein [Sphingomonas panacisoli]
MKFVKIIALALMSQACAVMAFAAPNSIETRMDALLNPYVASAQFNGVVIVTKQGKTIFAKAYGMANYEFGVPNRLDTRFKIASLSKPITDAALGVLLDAGKIRMDTKVSELIPDFPRGNEITVRHLVEHQSGVAHTNNLPEFDNITRMTLAQSVAILKTKPLDFTPGSKTSYSNGGFDVLAMMMERAAGMPFEQLLHSAVLDKLGMRDTGVAETFRMIPRLAEGYQPGDRRGVRARTRFYPVEMRRSGGSLYSTAGDIATFMRAAYGGTLISAASRRAVFGDDAVFTPGGRSPGLYSVTYADPAHDIYVVALSNNYSPVDGLSRRIYRAVTGEPPLAIKPMTLTDRKLEAKDADYYDGSFVIEQFGPYSRIGLTVQPDGRLVATSYYGEPTILIPLADGGWFYPLVDAICRPQGEARLERLDCASSLKEGVFSFTATRVPAP